MRRSSSEPRRGLFGRCCLVLALCSCALPGTALADEPAAQLVSRGLELRRERRDAEALALFQAAFATSAQPMILAQIALAEQALGRWPAAEQDLTSALAKHDSWVEANRGALEKALTVIRAHLSWLAVTTNVESAELWLDNRNLGKVRAAPWRVSAGTHELSLRLPDGRSAARSVPLAAGEREHFHLEFPKNPAFEVEPPRGDMPSAAPRPSAPAKSVAPDAAKAAGSAAAAHAASSRQTLAYASATLAVVALAEAVTASLLRLDYAHRYNSDACAPERSKQCAAYRDVADTLGNVAVVGYVVAGAAGLGSVALFTSPS